MKLFLSPRFSALLTLLLLIGLGSVLNYQTTSFALQTDFQKPDTTLTMSLEYYNSTSTDQTLYLAGIIGASLTNQLASGIVFQISEIKHTYPLFYTPLRGLTDINSADYKTKTENVNPADASFVNSENQLAFTLTPNFSNQCVKLTNAKGCAWDAGKRNLWDSDMQSCLGGVQLTCDSAKFSQIDTNTFPSSFGGRYEITLKIKATIEKEQLLYFPASIYEFTPAAKIKRSNNLWNGVSVYLSDKVDAVPTVTVKSSISSSSSSINSSESTPVSSNKSSNPSSSIASSPTNSVSTSSSSIVSVSSSSLSSSSSTVQTLFTPLTRNDLSGLDLTCVDASVNTKTTCSFTLPANKTLGTVSVQLADSGTTSPCVAAGVDVTCSNVLLPSTVGSRANYVFIDGVKIDSSKKVNALASTSPLVRTGSGNISYVVFLGIFVVVSVGILVIVNRKPSTPPIKF